MRLAQGQIREGTGDDLWGRTHSLALHILKTTATHKKTKKLQISLILFASDIRSNKYI